MKFDNVLTRMIGTKYPIIQGAFGMPGTSDSRLAVPVSEAGGLGILTAISFKDPDMFQEDLRIAKSKTDKPIAVNFSILHETKFIEDYFDDFLKITLDEGVETVFTSAYTVSNIGKAVKDAGGTWIHKCATIRHALSIEKKGADAVVIVGLEGTGFKNPDQHTTLINITAGRKLIKIPIIAAGGIGDGRGFVAALAAGAAGIYMGTAFMATKEYQAKNKLKNKIINRDITDPEYIKKLHKIDHDIKPSFASGVVDSVLPIKEFIDKMIKEAEEVMEEFKAFGMLE